MKSLSWTFFLGSWSSYPPLKTWYEAFSSIAGQAHSQVLYHIILRCIGVVSKDRQSLTPALIGAIPQFLSSLCSGNLVSIRTTLCAIRSMSIEFHRSLQQTKIVSSLFERYRNELLETVTILSLLYRAHDLYAMEILEGVSVYLPFLLSHPSFKLCHQGTVAVYNLLRDLAIGGSMRSPQTIAASHLIISALIDSLSQDWDPYFGSCREALFAFFNKSPQHFSVSKQILSSIHSYLSSGKEDDVDLLCACLSNIVKNEKNLPIVIDSGLVPVLMRRQYCSHTAGCLLELIDSSWQKQEQFLRHLVDCGLLVYLATLVKASSGKSLGTKPYNNWLLLVMNVHDDYRQIVNQMNLPTKLLFWASEDDRLPFFGERMSESGSESEESSQSD
jgi:hypothetical protein